MRAIDCRLTDPWLDPPEHDAFYVEKSVRLPHSFWCYDAEAMLLEQSPAVTGAPCAGGGGVAFGCFNNFCKINDLMLNLWKEILDAIPGSTLMLLGPRGSHRQRMNEMLGGRIRFEERRERLKYLELYRDIDIALDTFPYNGHTTGLDSLWMGVPVVTLAGQTAVSRAGLSQLSNLDLGDLVATTGRQFVEIAVGLARNPSRLIELRATLRKRMKDSPLMNAAKFARAVEAAYRDAWRAWCNQ